MFSSNSRYAKCPVVEIETAKGNKVNAVKLRRPPFTSGNPTEVKGTNRLDLMAQGKYGDGTSFWHIADANTELEANHLLQSDRQENPLAKKESKYILVPGS
jgi:hypothetical protein